MSTHFNQVRNLESFWVISDVTGGKRNKSFCIKDYCKEKKVLHFKQ
jgi:hypothetical protein